jgi:thioesterase domain-containing protein
VQAHGPYYIAGYCFGAVVAFEIAQRLLRSGEDVNLLAVFNGPSPDWTRRYGSISGQPSRLAQAPPRPAAPPRRSLPRRAGSVLVHPQKQARLARHVSWRVRKNYLDPIRIRLNREVPEEARGTYFLDLCGRAERAYSPDAYPGPMVVFYGDGLYDDPTLGWEPLVTSVRSIGVPGEHANNRTLMADPAAAALGERMQEILADARAGALRATRAETLQPDGAVATQPA